MTFRIYRMKDAVRQQFRWAPHSAGASDVKPRDYEEAGEVEAASFYAAWTVLKNTGCPLVIGDLLQRENGEIRIYKYVGFEEARWVLPEDKSGSESMAVATGRPG